MFEVDFYRVVRRCVGDSVPPVADELNAVAAKIWRECKPIASGERGSHRLVVPSDANDAFYRVAAQIALGGVPNGQLR